MKLQEKRKTTSWNFNEKAWKDATQKKQGWKNQKNSDKLYRNKIYKPHPEKKIFTNKTDVYYTYMTHQVSNYLTQTTIVQKILKVIDISW